MQERIKIELYSDNDKAPASQGLVSGVSTWQDNSRTGLSMI
jgi:hypothetical protein